MFKYLNILKSNHLFEVQNDREKRVKCKRVCLGSLGLEFFFINSKKKGKLDYFSDCNYI